jgi:hypothetical protein
MRRIVKKKENLIVDIVMWSTIYLNYKKKIQNIYSCNFKSFDFR